MLFILAVASFCLGQNEMVIGVSELEYKGDISKVDASAIAERIRSYVAGNSSYILIDSHLMNEIYKAQKKSFQASCCKKECLVSEGKLLYASLMIGGKVERNNNRITIHLLAVDVNLNKTINSVDSTISANRKEFFDNAVPRLCASVLKPKGAHNELVSGTHSIPNEKTNNADSIKSSSKTIVEIGVGSALAAGAVVAGYYFFTKPKNKSQNTIESSDIPIDDAPRHP